ncbi:MAG TPA: (2Fe-2S)-binding protein [Thermoanaerobaculia bacterium]|jgi:carbon-monoxide dehydrogenase small subunit|nr:(2Fe-2S)-binding protein [Thermoanaerobaculia bacterium]
MQPGWTSLVFDINGEPRAAIFPTHHTLLEVLREELALPGTKHGCELGECGTCAVLVDGRPILSCLALAADMTGKKIETVEGLQNGNALHPLQQTMADLGAAQCGYCTPGILMTAKALLAENPSPTDGEIRAALAGNLCRCTGYHKIVEAIEGAAALMRGEDWVAPREVLYGAVEPGREDRTQGAASSAPTSPPASSVLHLVPHPDDVGAQHAAPPAAPDTPPGSEG